MAKLKLILSLLLPLMVLPLMAAPADAQDNPAPVVDPVFYLKQADAALRDGRITQAGQMIVWLEHNNEGVSQDDIALLKAEHAIARMDIATAANALALVQRPTRNRCRVESAKGWLAAQSDLPNDAIISLGSAARNCPRDSGIWNLLGLALVQKGEAAAAGEAFQQALMLAPGHPEILNNHALALVQNGDLERAHAQLQDAIRYAPENRQILANADFVSGMMGMITERRSHETDNEWSVRLVNVAKGAKAASKLPQAKALFSRAVLTLAQYDEGVWAEAGVSGDIKP